MAKKALLVAKYNRPCCLAHDGPGACDACSAAFWKWFNDCADKQADRISALSAEGEKGEGTPR